MRITDCEIVRYTDGGIPVHRVPIGLVHDNPLALRNVSEDDAATMAEYLKLGQKMPIWIKEDGTILDGHRRVAGLRRLNHPTVDATIVSVKDGEDAVRTMLRTNTTIQGS